MALAISLERSLLPPFAASSGKGSPRKVHWVGGNTPVEPGQVDTSGGNDNPNPKSPRGYDRIADIKLGDVLLAQRNFTRLLIPSPTPGWVAPGYFCSLPLARTVERRPSAIFGRVKSCYPTDGQVLNVREMELLFPVPKKQPLELNLVRDDLDYESAELMQSYCAKIKLFISESEQSEFLRAENTFLQQGYATEIIPRYVDLVDVNEHNKTDFPDVIIVSSRWFAQARELSNGQAYEKLHQLIRWGKVIVNYHPPTAEGGVRTLNRELGFQFGFTDTVLIEPETPEQALTIVSRSFNGIFDQGMR